MTKKLLAMALLASGLTVGCGDEDVISPGARDAAGDTTVDAPPVIPGSDAMVPGSDAPVADAATTTDSGVDAGSTADTGTTDTADLVDTGGLDVGL